MTVARNYPKYVQRKSLCTLRNKNETSRSQACIGRYRRPWKFYLVLGWEMRRWYLIPLWAHGFQSASGGLGLEPNFSEIYPSGVEWIPLLTLRHLPSFKLNKPFANGLFSSEHEWSYEYSSSFTTTQLPVGRNTIENSKESFVGWEFGDAHLNFRLTFD